MRSGQEQDVRRALFITALLAASTPAWGGPTHYQPVIGGALMCRDEIDPVYLKQYLTTHFKVPYKTEGGAYWFKPNGATLFDMNVTELFVSTEDNERYVFIGAIILDTIKGAKEKIAANNGANFIPYPDENTQRSATGSFLIRYTPTQVKIYCVKEKISR
jgi:hypothetical protein